MEVIEVDYKEFSNIFPEPYHVFGSGDFAELNSDKADKICFLLFKDNKYRLGLTAGIRNNELFSPFSAPFGGFVFFREEIKINQIEDALDTFLNWAKVQNLKSLHIILPPPIYNESFISKQINVLYRKKFSLEASDLNFSFQTSNLTKEYSSIVWRNARKNLKIALESELSFYYCKDHTEKQKAYQVIQTNREVRGFPLRMTWEEVENTIQLVKSDFFITYFKTEAVAAAIVFHVANDIVQVIYWGDRPEYSHFRTMNFLSFKVFEYYRNQKIQIVDIGPSTENSIPNYGLCEFKESIGCDINTKPTLVKKLINDNQRG